jgi:Bcr/CflA subfamily drug resistance transporter
MIKKPALALIFPMVLVLYEIVNYLSNDMYLPALPQMMRSLHLGPSGAQFTLMWWFLGLAIAPLFMGLLADHCGRRPVLLWSGVVYILSSFVCMIASTGNVFMVARFFQGAMVSAMFVAGYAAIHESYEHKAAVKILALMASISVLAPALGPLLGGFILIAFSWRVIFGIITVWASLNVLALYFVMPETLKQEARRPFNVRAVAQQYSEVIFNQHSMILTLAMGFNMAGWLVWITASPLLLIETFGHTPVFYGWCQAVVFLANILGNTLIKTLIEKYALMQLIRFGVVIACVGVFLGCLVGVFMPNAVLVFVASVMIFAFGSGLSFAPLNRAIIEASSAPMGCRVAVFSIFLTLFCALGSVLSALFYNHTIFSMAVMMAASVSIAYIFIILYNKLSVPGDSADSFFFHSN